MSNDEERIALFLDYENLAIGANEDIGYNSFDLRPLAEALADRGRVVVRKAYADWNIFEQDRRMLTREQVELIEIPQRKGVVRKNAADIKMAVDAIELVFERSYISTFVIGTGDSDFTPLVNKLRELNKRVIGVGLKGSTSNMLPPACDEFIFYELLEGVDVPARKKKRNNRSSNNRKSVPDNNSHKSDKNDTQNNHEIDNSSDNEVDDNVSNPEHTIENLVKIVTSTLSGLLRSGNGPVVSSNLKAAILRKDSTFSEAEYGFRAFGELISDLQERGHIELSEGPSKGNPEISFPSKSDTEEDAFELLLKVVKANEPAQLDGLKNLLRKVEPDFSEKKFGYSGFLQFCKAASRRNIVHMSWSDEVDDYVLRGGKNE